MRTLISSLTSFWQQHPALYYGLGVLLGTFAAFHGATLLLIPLFLMSLILPWDKGALKRVLLAYILGLAAFFVTASNYQFPRIPPEGLSGTASIQISSLSENKSSFGKKWLYKGSIQSFIPDNSFGSMNVRNIPFVLSLPHNEEIIRPLANKSFRLHATLKQSSTGNYVLKVQRNEPWIPLKGSWSFAEQRFKAKKAVGQYIRESIPNERAAAFLSGIATGNFDDRLMSFEFARFGLQHIMAISGFHFAIVSGILCFILRLAVSTKKAYLLLILCLSSYFVFLGCGSSIMRAWITILIALGSYLVERTSLGLNSLGFAMLIILCFDPLSCLTIGFQFSFLTTAAILLFMTPIDHLLQQLFMKRALSRMVAMPRFEQHGYCILALFRQALALGIAVNLAALPLTLFYFHQFPWMSLIYNLFFPFMVSLAMLFLIIGLLFHFILPPLGEVIHAYNNIYTQFMLNFTHHMPRSFDFMLRTPQFPVEILIAYLCGILCLGIILKSFDERQKEQREDWAFI